ncbi:putative reverse transcriptase domain-containing protein [Tanacetum coccineum]
MPVELGSFDAIIGMDWLAKYQAVIVCAERIVRIPWRNKTLIVHGDGTHVTTKEVEDKSEKKRLRLPKFKTFPKYYLRTLPVFLRLDVEFQIDWVFKIAKPMTKLTQKKVKFVWGDKQETAFQLLKQKLCSAPILTLPEGSKDFIAYCNTSKKGLGAVLNPREKILNAQTEARKPENIKSEDIGGKLIENAKFPEAIRTKVGTAYECKTLASNGMSWLPCLWAICRTCHADEPLAVPLDGLHLDDKLHFVEEPVEIVGREVKRLKQSRISLVKSKMELPKEVRVHVGRKTDFKKKISTPFHRVPHRRQMTWHFNTPRTLIPLRPNLGVLHLVYGRDQGKHVDFDGFVDADYAKDPDKAEYIALTEAVKESIWLKGLLIELGVNLRSVVVNCDNQVAIHLLRNAMFHERTKHINVRYYFIREIVKSKAIEVAKIGTEDFPKASFNFFQIYHFLFIGVVPASDVVVGYISICDETFWSQVPIVLPKRVMKFILNMKSESFVLLILEAIAGGIGFPI